MANTGVFIVLEGSDGSGKTTQFNLLHHRLKAVGYDVEIVNFPRYDQPSSHFVRKYLNGEYGEAAEISPYTASLFYALDRYEAAKAIRKALDAGKIVLADRFVGSNMAHQGAKFTNPVEQRGFFVWNDNLEYELLNIPRPDFNIFLKVPADISFNLIAKRTKRSYTDSTHDEHEKDLGYLKRTVDTYDLLCKLFPKDFKAIDCVRDGEMMSITAINDLIWQLIKPHLPEKPSHKPHGLTVKLGAKVSSSEDKGSSKEPETKALTGKVSGLLLGHLSIPSLDTADVLARRWDKDVYAPGGLTAKQKEAYKSGLAQVTKAYESLETAATAKIKDSRAANSLLAMAAPLAALKSIKLNLSAEEAGKLAKELAGLRLDEAKDFSRLAAPGAKNGQDNKAVQEFDRLLGKLADSALKPNLSAETDDITLLEVSPRNEFEGLVDIVYPYSTLSREEIAQQIADWTYQQKSDAFLAAARSGNPAFSQISYKFDVLTSWAELIEFRSSGLHRSLEIQPATPRYGFKVPKLAEEAGIDSQFEHCFDESLKAFSQLQAVNGADAAQYLVLAGHKVRWQFVIDAQSLFRFSLDQEKISKGFMESLVEKVAERHPLVASALVTVPENPSRPGKKTSRGRRGGKPKKS